MLTVKQGVLLRAVEAGVLKRFYYPGARFDVILVGGRTRRVDAATLNDLLAQGFLVEPPKTSEYAYARWLITPEGTAAYREFRENRKWRG